MVLRPELCSQNSSELVVSESIRRIDKGCPSINSWSSVPLLGVVEDDP